MVKSVLGVFFNNWLLSVENKDLEIVSNWLFFRG